MKQMTAHCGLECTQCPSFIATRDDDDEARAKTAAYYRETYGFDLRPEEIVCDGCLAEEGRLLAYCRSCNIRTCCAEKGFETCAHCDDQPCAALIQLHAFSPHARASFDALKKSLASR